MRQFLLSVLLVFSMAGSAQHRCATPAQEADQIDRFEAWMEHQKEQSAFHRHINRQNELYTIPVVFHIIHNGELEGVGENIPESRILDQIDRLNEDFQKMNPRSGSVPSVFQAVEADVQIEFVLARQDPAGLPTNGIIRKQGSKSSYTFPGNDLKAESYWPAEDYLNIWVAETGAFIGWASFPETNLPGINESETNPLRDGVVLDDDFIGTNLSTDGTFDSHGQTLTHEIGHYLGLRHIWGDSNCGNDFCNDTPQAQDHHGNNSDIAVLAPCSFPAWDSCQLDSVEDMFMNFMDYTNDECLSMFTEDQKFRMRTVLENSPRRLSLRSSHGLDPPIGVLDEDMAFVSHDGIPIVTCSQSASPVLTFANHGINTISSYELRLTLNDQETSILKSGLSVETGVQFFETLELSNLLEGENALSWEVISVNGTQDDNSLNNTGSARILVDTEAISAPFRQDFESDTWLMTSTGPSHEWQTFSLSGNIFPSVQAFNGPSGYDNWLISPVFSLAEYDQAGLFFEMSYGIRAGASDQVSIQVLDGCDGEFEEIWNGNLATMSFKNSNLAWTPDENWLEQFVSLDDFAGSSELRLAIVFTNNGGNHFYLDNIELVNNSNPAQPRPEPGTFVVYPVPSRGFFDLTINFAEAQPVTIELMEVTGRIIIRHHHPALFNETIRFETPGLYGLYLLRIISRDLNSTSRVLIGR